MSKHAFVSGATGFLGQNLVRALLAKGWQITAMHRASSNVSVLHSLGVQTVVADILDERSLQAVMPENIDAVFHVAANTSMWGPQREQQWRENVEGTRNMCQAALARQAKRFVQVSSIAAYGLRDDEINELTVQTGAEAPINYYRSKAAAEVVVREAIALGLAAVIVNPSHIIGPFDEHNWARMFGLIRQEKLPGIPPGAGSFCYAPDVANALIAAAERGQIGHNYLLGGAQASFLNVVQIVGELLKKKVPARTVPPFALKLLGRINDAMSHITHKEPDITYQGALIICSHAHINSTRAADELDYRATPLREMLEQSLQWLAKKQGW